MIWPNGREPEISELVSARLFEYRVEGASRPFELPERLPFCLLPWIVAVDRDAEFLVGPA